MGFPIFAVVGIPVVFVLGFLGAILPSIVSFFYPSYGITRRVYFSFFNGLAAGLILAVGFVHSIPDSFESFSEAMERSGASEMTRDYAWPAWIAMMGVVLCFSVEELVEFLSAQFGVTNIHSHAPASQPSPDDVFPSLLKLEPHTQVVNEEELALDSKKQSRRRIGRNTVKMAVLFFGLLFHNVFVGLALGTSGEDHALFIAIVFHQFFEGLGLGSRIAEAKLRNILAALFIDFLFAAAAPVGIGIGLGIKSALEDGSMSYSVVEGTFQALSGGILIYVALTHMIRAYQEAHPESKKLQWHRFVSFLGLLFGAAGMSVIGIWA